MAEVTERKSLGGGGGGVGLPRFPWLLRQQCCRPVLTLPLSGMQTDTQVENLNSVLKWGFP